MLQGFQTAAFLLFAALALCSLTKKDPLPCPALSQRTRILLWAFFLLLMVLRCLRFGSVPGGVNQDEAMAAVDALSLARYGTDRFGTWLPAHFRAWGYGQMSVFLSYCMVPFFWLFGFSTLTVRLPVLLWSIVGIFSVYDLVRRRSERAAMFALLFLAVNPWHIVQSRYALDCNLFPHVFLLGLALLDRGREKTALLYLSMVPFALCMYCYGVAFLMVPLFLLLAALLLRVPFRRFVCCILLWLAFSWPVIGTMVINALGLETVCLPIVTMEYFPQSVRSGDILFFTSHPLHQLLKNARSVLLVAVLQKDDVIWNTVPGFGTLYRCTLPLVLLGLWHTAHDAVKKQDGGARLLLLYLFCCILLGLCVNDVNVNRINILFYALILLATRGAEALMCFRRESTAILLVCYSLLAGSFFMHYYTDYATLISSRFFGDFCLAARRAKELDADTYYITPGGWGRDKDQIVEILTLYTFEIDAHEYQSKEYSERFRYGEAELTDIPSGQNTVCILVEDPGNPDGWQQECYGDFFVCFPGSSARENLPRLLQYWALFPDRIPERIVVGMDDPAATELLMEGLRGPGWRETPLSGGFRLLERQP